MPNPVLPNRIAFTLVFNLLPKSAIHNIQVSAGPLLVSELLIAFTNGLVPRAQSKTASDSAQEVLRQDSLGSPACLTCICSVSQLASSKIETLHEKQPW